MPPDHAASLVPWAPSLHPISPYQLSAFSTLGKAQSSGRGWGLSLSCSGAIPNRPTLTWAVDRQQPHTAASCLGKGPEACQPVMLPEPSDPSHPIALFLTPAVLQGESSWQGLLAQSQPPAMDSPVRRLGSNSMRFPSALLFKTAFIISHAAEVDGRACSPIQLPPQLLAQALCINFCYLMHASSLR